MKILHVITTIERGGAENQLMLLSEHQVLSQNEVSIVYLKGNPELKKEFESNGTKIISNLSNKNFISQILGLRILLKNIQPDIVHAHLPQAELITSLSINFEHNFVISRHFGGQFYPRVSQRISSMLGRIASRNAKSVIAISNSVKVILIKNREIAHPDKIIVVHYGFSKNRFLKNSKGTTPADVISKGKNFRIGTVARLSPEKDLQTLIKAFAILNYSYPKIELEIAGSGTEEERLKRLCKTYGLENKIRFLGKIENIPDFIRSLNLFVLTSKFEGFGMALLEAMSVECKIIAAKNTAIVEVVGLEGAGIFFKTSDEQDLVEKIRNSLNDNDIKYKIQQNKQIENFTVAIMGNKIDKVYKSII